MEQDLYDTLQNLNLRPRRSGKGWSIRCPKHEDRNNSAECFPDGWCCCFAGCGRFHINTIAGREVVGQSASVNYEREKEEEIKRGDFTQLWTDLDPLPNDLDVKGISGKDLNKLGWRWYPGGNGYREGIFMPYFNLDRSKVPFFQIRHMKGDRRFSFAKSITPILNGFEVLPKTTDFVAVTEGLRDEAILRTIGIPAVALPSASSTKIIKGLEKWTKENNKRIVAICDKDEAGESLLKALESPYEDARSPVGKDVGDFLQERGWEALKAYYNVYRLQEGTI